MNKIKNKLLLINSIIINAQSPAASHTGGDANLVSSDGAIKASISKASIGIGFGGYMIFLLESCL
jgi:hypothetical protein